jgi:hypothetical protein
MRTDQASASARVRLLDGLLGSLARALSADLRAHDPAAPDDFPLLGAHAGNFSESWRGIQSTSTTVGRPVEPNASVNRSAIVVSLG